MKRIHLACLLFFYISSLAAQQFNITGVVSDSADNPIEFATIALWEINKQKIRNGCTSESNGRFTLTNIPQGKYILSCQFLGYQTKTLKIKVEQHLAIDTIKLQEDAQTLAEVEIKADRVQRKGNGFIVNMQNSQLSKGKSAMNTLNFLPGVNVHNNQISINGREGTIVYINGREVKNSQELQMLDAETIKNIEIIPVANAEYRLSANGGILKIETRKTQEGGSIVMFGNRLITDSKGLKTEMLNNTFQYRKGRWSIYNMVMGGFGNYHPQNTEKTTLHNNGNSTSGKYYSRTRTRLAWADIFDLQYNINERQQIGIDLSVQQLNDSLFKESANNLFVEGEKPLSAVMNGNGKRKYNKLDATASYRNRIDKRGSYFQIKGTYSYRKASTNGIYDYSKEKLSYRETESNNSVTKVTQIEPKIVYRFANKGTLASGLAYTYLDDDNDIAFLSNASGQWDIVPNSGKNYKMRGNDYAAYLNYSLPFHKKWWTSAGLRYQKDVLRYHAEGNATIKKNYQGIYPTFTLSYLLQEKKKRMLSLSYRHYHSLPNFGYYSPARIIYSDNSYAIGNPNIDHELFHLAELTYSHNAHLNIIYSFKAGKDLIRVLTFKDNDNDMTTYTQPVNAGNDYLHTLHVDYTIPIRKSYHIRLNGRLNYEDANFGNNTFKQWFYTANAILNLRFTPTWGGTLSGNYFSRRKYADYKYQENYVIDICMDKSFLKGKLLINLQVHNLFTPASRITTVSPNILTSYALNRNPKTEFIVGVTYRFNTGKKIKNISIIKGSSFDKSSAEQ